MSKSDTSPKINDVASFDNVRQNLKRLSCGAVAGLISRTCTAPIERIAILQQTRNPTYLNHSIPQIFTSMIKNEGPLSLWKGNGANVVRIMPFAAIELFAFEFYKAQFAKLFKIFNTNNEYRSFFYLVAGGLSGMSASALVEFLLTKSE